MINDSAICCNITFHSWILSIHDFNLGKLKNVFVNFIWNMITISNNNWYWFIIAFILTFSTINYTFKLNSWKVLHLYNCIITYIIVNNDMKCISNTSNQNFIVRRSIQGMCLMTISFHLILLVQSHNRNHLGRFWYDVPVQGAFF